MKRRNRDAKTQTSKAKESEAKPQLPAPTHEQIQQRAYEIYSARGGVPGQELDDWLQAERELIGPGAHQRIGDGRTAGCEA